MPVRGAHPLPNPPRKVESERSCVVRGGATVTEQHLPHCGGGWEGGGHENETHELHRAREDVAVEELAHLAPGNEMAHAADLPAQFGA